MGAADTQRPRTDPVNYACFDQCCCGVPVAIFAVAQGLPSIAARVVGAPAYAEAAITIVRRPHSHPFANGPPAL
jgi:hypothetical protein